LGLVTDMPSGPGIITDDLARTIATQAPPAIAIFLLTSRTGAVEIAEQARHCATNTVQIVQHVDPSVHEHLAKLLPVTKRVQVIHVEDKTALQLAHDYAPYVDALLLDSGRPGASQVELGGTGRTHDWSISAEIVGTLATPVFLAGGLTPDNVAAAIAQVQPFGVDLCSGLRSAGALDPAKLQRFMNNANRVQN
jgi:phosphoribosylanthranilate isomerase